MGAVGERLCFIQVQPLRQRALRLLLCWFRLLLCWLQRAVGCPGVYSHNYSAHNTALRTVNARHAYLVTQVSDVAIPALRHVLAPKEHVTVILHTGIIENAVATDARSVEAAARTVTDTTAAFTRAFLELQRATPAARARLLVLDSPPQHFDTPMGLFAAGRPQRRPCRGALAANASHAQALAHGPGNFRNIAKVRGVALALAELAGGNASTPAERRVAFVRGWATAAQLDGADAHWHHDSPDGGDGADRRNLAAGGADCTHDSPSALLYRMQALVAALV